MLSSASDTVSATSYKTARSAERGRSGDVGFAALVDSNVAADDSGADRPDQASTARRGQDTSSTRDSAGSAQTSDRREPARRDAAAKAGDQDQRTKPSASDAAIHADGAASQSAQDTADAGAGATLADAEAVLDDSDASEQESGSPKSDNADKDAASANARAASTQAATATATVSAAAGLQPPPTDHAASQDAGAEQVADAAQTIRTGKRNSQHVVAETAARSEDSPIETNATQDAAAGAAQTKSSEKAESAGEIKDAGKPANDHAAGKPVTEPARADAKAIGNSTASSADDGHASEAEAAGDAATDTRTVNAAAGADRKADAAIHMARTADGTTRADAQQVSSIAPPAPGAGRDATADADRAATRETKSGDAEETKSAKPDQANVRTGRQAASAQTSADDTPTGQNDVNGGLRPGAGDAGASHAAATSTQALSGANIQTVQHGAPQVANTAGGPVVGVPLQALAVEIAARSRDGSNRFEIRLDPKELGRIDVRLDVDRHGNVTSRLFVERAETLDLLRRDAPNLERALQDAGLKTSDNGLQFSLRDQGQNQRDERADARAQILIADEEQPATNAGRGYGRMPGGAGGLDIRV